MINVILSEREDHASMHGRKNMVEKIVFAAMMIIALGGGVLGCIYELGGKKRNPEEKEETGEKECEEA